MRKSRVKSFFNCKYILCYFSVQGQDYILFRTRIKNFQVKLRSQVLIVNIIFSGANYLKWERKKNRKKKTNYLKLCSQALMCFSKDLPWGACFSSVLLPAKLQDKVEMALCHFKHACFLSLVLSLYPVLQG